MHCAGQEVDLHPVGVWHYGRGHDRATDNDDPGNDPDIPESLPHGRPLFEEMR